jgi:spectinomycin phosphotransferase
MLEPPPLSRDRIVAHLVEAHALSVATLDFLPLGADVNTAVYRAEAHDGTAYFVKLRRGAFSLASVAVPRYLADLGIAPVIPPIPDLRGRLFSPLDDYSVILYPFVEGRNAYAAPVTDEQRRVLGRALAAIHGAAIPSELLEAVPAETYSPRWREAVADFQARVERDRYEDPVAAEMAAFMRARRQLISDLVARAAALAEDVRGRDLPRVLCHADLHAGNLHVTPDARIRIVDWDTVIRAPKERDLMFVGSGIDRVWPTPAEAAAFYAGYGQANVDADALAYYRCERAVEDIAAFCQELLLSDEGGADRAQSLRYFKSGFEPGDAIDVAMKTRTARFP